MRAFEKKSFFFLAVIFAVSCQLEVPIKEMARAKKTITRAYEVKADRYDPENLKKAEAKLFESHDNLKEDKADPAKTSANEAYMAASEAVKKSLPLLARDTLEQARTIHVRAVNFNAEKYAPAELAAGGALIQEADSLNTEKKYWDSYLKSIAAIDTLNTAISAAEEAASALEVTIGKLKAERDDLERQDARQSAAKELTSAGTALIAAEEALKNDMIKDSEQNVDIAVQYLKAAKIKIAVLGAREKIALLRGSIEKLKNERGSDFAPEEINSALGSLNEAESLLDQEKNEDALVKITDAENHYLAALLKTEKGMAEDRIKNAEALLQKVLTADTKMLYRQETDNSAALIQEAKDQFAAQAYRESSAKAGEAEKILNALNFSVGQEYGAQPVQPDQAVQQEDNVTYYVVKLNVKDRDCLWKIAQRLYNNARMWPVIYVANKDQIKDPDLIFPGQRFRIPPLSESKPAGAPDGEKKKEEPAPEPAATKPDDTQTAPAQGADQGPGTE